MLGGLHLGFSREDISPYIGNNVFLHFRINWPA